jgi:hypothetical protein
MSVRNDGGVGDVLRVNGKTPPYMMNHWWWSYIKSYPTPELWLCDLSYRIDGLIKQLMRQNKTILPTFHKKFFATHAWSAILWAKLFDWIPLLHEHILYIRIHTATYYKLESFISIYRYMAKSGFTLARK